MTKPIPLKQKQVTALCKGAAAAGCIAEVKIGDVFIRLIPIDHAQPERRIDDEEDLRF